MPRCLDEVKIISIRDFVEVDPESRQIHAALRLFVRQTMAAGGSAHVKFACLHESHVIGRGSVRRAMPAGKEKKDDKSPACRKTRDQGFRIWQARATASR